MKRVYIAATLLEERADLRNSLLKLNMQIVGESSSWQSVLALAPPSHPEVVVVNWKLIAHRSVAALKEVRAVCPGAAVIITPGGPERKTAGTADNPDSTTNRLTDRLQAAIASIRTI